eukprot:CAMPEP_0118688696 /NCGR_PEP_ID=MMETSP0800-20121206/9065_1 /TAXON_ID=210618 ORGANISM="Striatella unipunctata, Strain CCMP2910" /NCGR_SAMPLE_ID=MMETSP0800 /ASSEMBLY_ACC=CAM_ASM_000638 /LENGTH=318 /DNA_ID=CAMNT_0006585987 /DNA_START=62 /DNA_END=1019 /DNA_ORIENTATION=+
MVQIDEIIDDEEEQPIVEEVPSPSESRHKTTFCKITSGALAKKLRKESAALKRVEESKAKATKAPAAAAAAAANVVEESASPSAPTPSAPPAKQPQEQQQETKSVSATPSSSSSSSPASAPPLLSTSKYVTIDRFAFDAGDYGSSHVKLYIDLPVVGGNSLIRKENVTCNFTPTSFDLIAKEEDNSNNNGGGAAVAGKSYRLFKDNLDKDIDPDKSKVVVKSGNRIIVKLAKVKSSGGSFDYWTQLTSNKKKKVGTDGKSSKENPSASIMDMMKDMYESGDDNMKKMIGETMMKQRNGQLGGGGDGVPGMGGLDGMDF